MRSCGATPHALRSASTRSGVDRGGRRQGEIRAAVDDADALARRRIERAHETRRVMRIGDDDVAARHDRVVEDLDRRASGIAAVVGRHEGQVRAPARRRARPRPGARERAWTRATPSSRQSRRGGARSSSIASGFLVAGRERHPDAALAPAARRRGGRPRSRRAPAPRPRRAPAAMSTAVRSAPPASSSGMICRTVRPASGCDRGQRKRRAAGRSRRHMHRV